MPRSPHVARPPRAGAAMAALFLLVSGAAACSESDGPEDTVTAFLNGWRTDDLNQVGFVGTDGASFPAQQAIEQIRSLSGALVTTKPTLSTAGEPSEVGGITSAPITVAWPLPGGQTWSYRSTVRMTQRNGDGWRVIWEPAVVHPELTLGDKLAVRRLPAARAGILDAAGKPIVTERPVVLVGLYPEKIRDLPRLTRTLETAFKKIDVTVDLKDLPKRVEAAAPDQFLELVPLRQSDYDKIRDEIRPLEGTQFIKENRDLAPTRAFARALLGSVDPATKDDINARPDTIAVGDLVGHGGLQQRYDPQLRGAAGQAVVISQEAPDGKVTDKELFRLDPRAGSDVRTTLDVATQNAADQALADEKRRSAMVAVRVSDAAVLAVANGPEGAGTDLALTAQVPPGSIMKMVSTLGLLERKAVTLDGVLDCPRNHTVDGRPFRNSNNFQLGRVPFRTIFAQSCNTAFAALAGKLGPDGLAKAAAQVGIGTPWELGVETFSGKVSTGGSAAEQAAAAFGQGTTVVSPVAMAGATAAVARGEFRQPRLVLDPAPAAAPPAPTTLPAEVVPPLQEMMREVVTKGTGKALRDVGGEPVHGKTGTAEFEDSKDTHAWFVGWQGDVAFAVFVEKGGAGADAAVPIAERFLRGLTPS